jgi:Flp pilus assembly protein TadD
MISLLLGSVECVAQSATAESLSPPILPAKTPVMLHLKKNLYKKDAKPGQPVEFEVGFDVVVNGEVFIQSGAAVTGSVRQVDQKGKDAAKVLIDLGSTRTVSGELVPLAGPATTTANGEFDVMMASDFPPMIPVFLVMKPFEKKMLLDKDAWWGVWVVTHVEEDVALDPAKLKIAEAQRRESLRQERLPKSSMDARAIFGVFFEANLLDQAGDLDGAIKVCREALALKADSLGLPSGYAVATPAALHFRIAELFREKRDFVHAISEYRTALQLDPNDESFRIGLVTALEDSGDLDTALAESEEAIRIWPDKPYFHYLLGRLLVKKNDPDVAIAELQWVLKQEKNRDWRASCALGGAYELRGDLKEALGEYHTAYRVQMDDQQCRAAYERLRLQLKK